MDYADFIHRKSQLSGNFGFKPLFMPDAAFDHQKSLASLAIERGRAATFADCGLGKTLMELIWAKNVVMKENKPVIIFTPLAVAPQFVHEGEKFGIECNSGSSSARFQPISTRLGSAFDF